MVFDPSNSVRHRNRSFPEQPLAGHGQGPTENSDPELPHGTVTTRVSKERRERALPESGDVNLHDGFAVTHEVVTGPGYGDEPPLEPEPAAEQEPVSESERYAKLKSVFAPEPKAEPAKAKRTAKGAVTKGDGA